MVITAVRALLAYLAYHSAEFGVSTQRVMVKRGVFTLRSTEILIPKIEAIQVEQNIWGRLLNFGTVTVIGTGGTQEVFPLIERPYDLRNAVQSQLVGRSGDLQKSGEKQG